MFKSTGFLAEEERKALLPTNERLEKGAVAIIECPEPIPCNPCQNACPRNAIKKFSKITDLPVIDFDLCNGCGNCIAVCPGLAIYVLQKNYSEKTSLLKIPYEMLPIPEKEEECEVLSRSGEIIGKGTVKKIQAFKVNPKGRVLWIEVPKSISLEARNIRLVRE